MRARSLITPGIAVLALLGSSTAYAAGNPTGGSGAPTPPPTTTTTTTTTPSPQSGGAGVGAPPVVPSTPVQPTVPGYLAQIINGVAYAPSLAPIQVKRAIWAGNAIRHKPYIFGGGHGRFRADGYDCSGSVSYVLHAAGLLKTPYDSSQFMAWGQRGFGIWMTVYTNPGHAFIEIAGIRLDTSNEGDRHPARGTGPRWRPLFTNTRGFLARHPAGY